MSMCENFICFISDPYMIALIILIFTLKPTIKYLRRFTPESYQKAAIEFENFSKELQRNKEDKKIYMIANLKLFLFIFGPTLFLLCVYFIYSFLIEPEFSFKCLREGIGKISALGVATLGIYLIKMDRIDKFLFRKNYQKIMELTNKQIGNDPLLPIYKKSYLIFGYFFLLLAIVGFIAQLFGIQYFTG